eukprot:m.8921 g.8921  ORF g.8921 m.8921 type:complete len:400 (+) comp3973_c0_seq1:26-1225(+)
MAAQEMMLLSMFLFALPATSSSLFGEEALKADQMVRHLFPPLAASQGCGRCLDGSPAGYYLKEKKQSRGWVIYLQGGGLCLKKEDCERRVHGNLGSSKNWSLTHVDNANVLSDNHDNPFMNFSKVYVPYCSGDTYTGTSAHNLWLGGLHTCGHNILNVLIDQLFKTTSSFKHATHLLFSGGSAGGIGVFHNADFITDKIKSLKMNTTVKAAPQGGYYFPKGIFQYNMYAKGKRIPFDLFATGYVNMIQHGYTDPSCAKALGNQKARCWNIDILQKYISTPLFIGQDNIDSNQIHAELGCPGKVCEWNSTNKIAVSFMEDYANKTRRSLHEFAQQHSSKAGSVWSPSCLGHTGEFRVNGGPLIKGKSYREALKEWFFDNKRTVLIEECPHGIVCNPACIH